MSAANVLKFIKEKEADFVDLRFTDPRGKLQHLTMDVTIVDEEMLNDGVFFWWIVNSRMESYKWVRYDFKTRYFKNDYGSFYFS